VFLTWESVDIQSFFWSTFPVATTSESTFSSIEAGVGVCAIGGRLEDMFNGTRMQQ
jgi:hypothetical protein